MTISCLTFVIHITVSIRPGFKKNLKKPIFLSEDGLPNRRLPMTDELSRNLFGVSDEMVEITSLFCAVTKVLRAVIVPFPLLNKQPNRHQNNQYHNKTFSCSLKGAMIINKNSKGGYGAGDHCGRDRCRGVSTYIPASLRVT